MMRHPTGAFTLLAAAALIAGTAAACSDDNDNGGNNTSTRGNSASVAGRSAGTVTSRSGPLGTILIDGKGRTLYLFRQDKTSKSTCNGACATEWPPFTVTGNPRAGREVKAGLLSTSTRSDGKKQVTYNGHPLYRFSGDPKPGNTKGQGVNAFGALWYVVGTDGKQITTKPQNPGGGY